MLPLIPLLILSAASLLADSNIPTYRADVQMVTVSFKVERGGRPVTAIAPSEIKVLEDGVEQRIDSFVQSRASEPENTAARVPMSIFILVDTSNAMYRDYAHAYDSIADFIRSIDPEDSVAVYTFSRNLFRAAKLTKDRYTAIAGLQRSAAGDDTALYNSLLLTVRDAAKVPGPKQIVVFSNGPDDASAVGPDDVARVAETEGIPISVVSTNLDSEINAICWGRITSKTGGEVFTAARWTDQRAAFRSLAEMVRNTYTLTYYSNSDNPGFRRIQVQIKGGDRYAVRCRSGYYPPPPGARREWMVASGSPRKE